MSFTASGFNPSCMHRGFVATVYSLSSDLASTAKKIKDAVASRAGQAIFGFGLGVASHKIYAPLTEKILKFIGVSATLPDPFLGLNLGVKILLIPFIAVLGPIWEEKMFRGDLQETLKDRLNSFYMNQGFSDSSAKDASRITSLFFSSVLFGLMHFTNAIVFWCNPVLFLPQVIATTIMGILFGLAKEFSGELYMPCGMHIGNNTLAMTHLIYAC